MKSLVTGLALSALMLASTGALAQAHA
ncbi:MAG: hypothetical protein PWQ61_2781, partial [Betaproteobacteria bacterium]|nr:hypothetical protein [Betaproteobacteria bacterium]